jgi:hypothetical protein
MVDLWNTIKKPNLWSVVIEEEEVQVKWIEIIFNKIAELPEPWERGGHPGTGGF